MRRAFTMVEMLLATVLVGVLTALSVLTFNSVSNGWHISADYMDKMQRTDFALNQLVAGLRSMYYPHDGSQTYDYGFVLADNGDGEKPGDSDVIEWSKTGAAIVGTKNAVADTVHRVQVMILEEGDSDYKEPIEVTGLYARQCPDVKLRSAEHASNQDIDYSFANDELYQPVLIADGIVGFDCKVLKSNGQVESETDGSKFEDVFDASNSVPYKVQLTFRMADPEGRSYRTNTAPLMRIVTIPIYEQAQDGARTPGEEGGDGNRRGGGRRRGGGMPPPGRGAG